MSTRDWRHLAACHDEDPELFFPLGEEDVKTIAEAKAICRRCPVSGECLASEFKHGDDYGVWGGLTEGERREVRRRELTLRFARSA